MFNVPLDYPSFEEGLVVVKNTTSSYSTQLSNIIDAEQILFFQQLVRKIPVTDNVLEYAFGLVAKTRP